MMTVYAHSLDFDGCLSNPRFLYLVSLWDKHRKEHYFDVDAFYGELKEIIATHNERAANDQEIKYDDVKYLFDFCFNKTTQTLDRSKLLIKANQELFNELRTETTDLKPILFIGSNRQSYTSDLGNAGNLNYDRYKGQKKYGSAFPFFEQLAHDLEFQLDTMLLADIYQSQKHGIAFQISQECSYEQNEDLTAREHEWLFDETKLSILYAQMHKLASQYPNEPIVFNYVDDRDDIIKPLIDYFTEHTDMIPKNITLNITQYNGTLGKTIAIKGQGSTDTKYDETVRHMAAVALHGARLDGIHDCASYDVAKERGFNIVPIKFHQYYTHNAMVNYDLLEKARQELYNTLDLIQSKRLSLHDKLMMTYVEQKTRVIEQLKSPEQSQKLQEELNEMLQSLQSNEATLVMQEAASFKTRAGLFTIGMRKKAVLIEQAMLNTPLSERGTVISSTNSNLVQDALASHRHIGRLSFSNCSKTRSFKKLKDEVKKQHTHNDWPETRGNSPKK